MNKYTKIRSTKPVAILIIVILAAIAGVGVVAFVRTNSPAAAETDLGSNQSKPKFSFTGAADWRQGPTNATSMALFSKAREDGTSACFTSVEYKAGTVTTDAQLQEQEKTFADTGGTMSRIATFTTVLQTSTGDRQYELHQFSVTSGSDSEKVMGGLELGYLQLDDGYVKIEGHCNGPEELPSTIPALEAYKLN